MAKKTKKIFVLDTSVIIFDHDAIKNFQLHDITIPIVVLEELDNFKKGHDLKNFAAREFSRFVDKQSEGHSLQEWIPIGKNKGHFTIVMNMPTLTDAIAEFGEDKADHRILNAAIYMMELHPEREVVLVSKDINLRIKAKSLGVKSEDYETGKIKGLEPDKKAITKGVIDNFHEETINKLYENEEVSLDEIKADFNPESNAYYILKNGQKSVLSYFEAESQKLVKLSKENAFKIKPKNAEQAFALHALMNDKVKLVTIQGVAGTGKTLLSLAGALEQRRHYHQIFLARPVVPLGNKDIGYLPGDVKSKLNPYMEPLWDNLKFIKSQYRIQDKEYKQIEEMVSQEKLLVTPLAYIRGRSLSNIFFIIDEAQNLTPHEVKTIISRAGDNTKIIFTGDVFQIDTPYLDAESNGLAYLIDRLKGNNLYAHITLEKGERSELANLANEFL